MRIALICPFSTGPIRGNITTVRRIADYLSKSGCRTTVLPLDALSPAELRETLVRFRPDLLHAFHAFHAGPVARELALETGVPYLITLTGSDLFDPAMNSAPATRKALADCGAVSCFDSLVARTAQEVFPEAAGKLAVVPQGVVPLPVSEPYPRTDGQFLILLPAALRPVKGIIQALDALTPLAEEIPSLRLLLAGGDLDPVYARTVRQRAAQLAWVHQLGEVPFQNMGALYAAADLALNCSLFEGGMANTLLEAMSMGRPVVARNIPGNRSLIRHGKTGWLYESDDDLRDLVRWAISGPEQLTVIARAAERFIRRRCSPEIEARRYVRIYERLTGRAQSAGDTLKTA